MDLFARPEGFNGWSPSEFTGEIVAIRWSGDLESDAGAEPRTFTDPVTGEDETVERPWLLVDGLIYRPDGTVEDLGRTRCYLDGINRDVRKTPGKYQVARLIQLEATRSDWSGAIVLEDLDDTAYGAATVAFSGYLSSK